MAFDPMTGKPIEDSNDMEMAFDPMTGEPIIKQPTPVQPSDGFDPITGKPLGQPEPTPVQDASYSKGKKGRKNMLPVLIGGIVAAALVVVLVIVAAMSGLFLGKAGKVMMATANTFKDRPHFVAAFEDIAGILVQNKYTIALSGDMDDVQVKGELRNGGKEKQLSVQLKQSGSMVDLVAGIDSKNVKFQVPQLSNYVFVYDYTKTSTGYLADEMGDDTVEQLNAMLKSLTGQTDAEKFCTELFKIFTGELKSVSFVNAEKEEFTIDEKDVDCKGYTAVLTGSNMIHVVDKVEKLVNDEYASLFQAAYAAEMEGYSSEDWKDAAAEMFDGIREELEDMDDIEMTFYLYKNKLAGIVLRVPDQDAEAELCFEGGDYRMQNMTLKVDGQRYRLSGSDEDKKEKFTLETRNGSDREQVAKLEYNYDNGKFSVNLDGVTISGKLISSKSEVNLKISDVESYYYSVSPDLSITVKKGAKMEKYDGKQFDLGKADEDDYRELLEDIQDKMYDKDLDWLMYLY